MHCEANKRKLPRRAVWVCDFELWNVSKLLLERNLARPLRKACHGFSLEVEAAVLPVLTTFLQ